MKTLMHFLCYQANVHLCLVSPLKELSSQNNCSVLQLVISRWLTDFIVFIYWLLGFCITDQSFKTILFWRQGYMNWFIDRSIFFWFEQGALVIIIKKSYIYTEWVLPTCIKIDDRGSFSDDVDVFFVFLNHTRIAWQPLGNTHTHTQKKGKTKNTTTTKQ